MYKSIYKIKYELPLHIVVSFGPTKRGLIIESDLISRSKHNGNSYLGSKICIINSGTVLISSGLINSGTLL